MIKVTNKLEMPTIKTVYDLKGGATFLFYDTDAIYLLSEEEDYAICLTDGAMLSLYDEDCYRVENFERIPIIECDITLEIGKISK